MSNIFQSVRKTVGKKQFKYGGYAVLLTLGAIVFIVLLNIGLTVLENNFDLRVDMSQNKKLTLTDQTKKIVQGLQKDIYIYTLYTPGSEDSQIDEILRKFKGLSSHIITENRDPDKDPRFMEQFTKNNESITAGQIIVTDAQKSFYRVLAQTDLYQYEYNNQNDPTTPTGVQIIAEGSITQAVNYISSGFIPTVYVVEGHGELKLSDVYYAQEYLTQANYKVESISLSQTPEKVKAGDLLMFLAPLSDITDAERDLLKPLVEKGGRFIFVFDPVKMGDKKLPNIESLLKLYDISLKPGLVYETNMQYRANDSPLLIAPQPGSHDITSVLAGSRLPVYFMNSGAINLPEVAPESTITITPLYTTSSDSFIKKELIEGNTVEKAAGDESGPFTLAVAAEKKGATDADKAQMIVINSTEFLTNPMFVNNSSNLSMFLISTAWMRNAEKDIYIRGKTITSQVLGFQNDLEKYTVMVLSCFVVPVLLLVAGVVVYLRRKHL